MQDLVDRRERIPALSPHSASSSSLNDWSNVGAFAGSALQIDICWRLYVCIEWDLSSFFYARLLFLISLSSFLRLWPFCELVLAISIEKIGSFSAAMMEMQSISEALGDVCKADTVRGPWLTLMVAWVTVPSGRERLFLEASHKSNFSFFFNRFPSLFSSSSSYYYVTKYSIFLAILVRFCNWKEQLTHSSISVASLPDAFA